MKNQVAFSLLEIGAVSLRTDPPFTWASGRLSPIYCDNRLLMSYPARRKAVSNAFADVIRAKDLRPEVIAGTATAGIPHAAWLAERLDLPMVYVRASAKSHGKENLIEGKLSSNARTVLIEDLISTGGSSVEAALALKDARANVVGVLSIFTYGLEVAAKKFRDAGMPHESLVTFDDLMEAASDIGALRSEERDILGAWRQDPAAWSLARGGA